MNLFLNKDKNWNLKYFPSNKISNKKIFVFACFFYKNNYLLSLYYLKEIFKTGFSIILVADNNVIQKKIYDEMAKYCFCICFKKHNKYDFGSYKKGYEIMMSNFSLNDVTDLIFSNDSIIGPISSLKNIISKMNKKNVDFWGLSSNIKFGFHIQSYFLHFNNKIINNKDLYMFLSRVKKEKDYNAVVLKYEVLLTSYLISLGYTFSTFLPLEIKVNLPIENYDKTVFGFELIKFLNFPFVKVKCFTEFYKLCDERKKILLFLKMYNRKIYEIIRRMEFNQ